MPRTSKTSDGAASSSAAGGGEETTDGAKKRQKLTVQDKDQLRELKRRFSQDMYAMAAAYRLKNTLESIKTEGRGETNWGWNNAKNRVWRAFCDPYSSYIRCRTPLPDPGGAGWRWRVAPTATSGASDNRYVHTSTEHDHMHNEAAWEGRRGLRQGR